MSVELPEKFKPLAPWFERHRRDCWLPVVEDGDGDVLDSKFSGTPWLAASEKWPTCANCRKGMALFLQLNLSTAPEWARKRLGNGLFQAFFCADYECICGPDEGDPFTHTHLLRVVDPSKQPGGAGQPPAGEEQNDEIPVKRIVRWERVDDYPSMTEAELLGLVHEVEDEVVCNDPKFSVPAKLKEFFTMPWARDNEKLGGWPGWANISAVYPDCPRCGRQMDVMIFQFGCNGYIPIMFADEGQGHVVCCPDHPDVLAYPWTCG